MHIRTTQVAGMFYDDRPEVLRPMIERFISNAAVEPCPKKVCALIVPHAGYVYSGATAAYAYKRASTGTPGRIVLLGVSHRHRFPGLSLCEEDFYETPLGRSRIDRDFTGQLRGAFTCSDSFAHDSEHTIETQLPFVQFTFGDVPIVPVLFGAQAGTTHITFGEQLAGMLDKHDLVIASTDLSHFFSETTANRLDGHSIKQVLAGNMPVLIEELSDERCSMCGGAAVIAAMAHAKASGAQCRNLLDYATSAAFSGDFNRVVGYAAFSLEYEESST